MGRYDFMPSRVHEVASMLLKTKRIQRPPAWHQTLGEIPTSQNLVRTIPVQHQQRQSRQRRTKKASKLFKPQQISYQEDDLRQEFFSDHPWELARPRLLVENDGKDHQTWDWSKAYQNGRPVNGESVVQRQRWLMNSDSETNRYAAYDQARKELYKARHYAQMEARIAREEALSAGAYFEMTANEIGMKLENEEFDRWRIAAAAQVTLIEQSRSAAYTGVSKQSPLGVEERSPTESKSGLEAAAEELAPSIPATKAGQTALGGAMIHP